jgi:hypothetical protein
LALKINRIKQVQKFSDRGVITSDIQLAEVVGPYKEGGHETSFANFDIEPVELEERMSVTYAVSR